MKNKKVNIVKARQLEAEVSDRIFVGYQIASESYKLKNCYSDPLPLSFVENT